MISSKSIQIRLKLFDFCFTHILYFVYGQFDHGHIHAPIYFKNDGNLKMLHVEVRLAPSSSILALRRIHYSGNNMT